jgi:hypothetical protein
VNRDPAISLPWRSPPTSAPVRQIAMPTPARALNRLSRVDYEDAFTLEIEGARPRTGEQWAQATLGSAPAPLERAVLLLLTSVTGLQLSPFRSDGFVLGWQVQRSTPEFAVLAARSPRGLSAELLFKPEQSMLLFATFIQLDTPIARAIWAALSPLHRQVARSLLRQASRQVREEADG